MEGQRSGRDVAAIGPADHADRVITDPVLFTKPVTRGHDIAQVFLAVAAVIHMVEGLAITGRAPVVGCVDRIAVIDEVLDHG